MKKILFTLVAFLVGFTAYAQSDVNRMLIVDKNGYFKGFALENVDYASFANVTGEVRADVTISDVALDKIVMSVTRTSACQGFKLVCVPTVQIANYTDQGLAQFIDSDNDYTYYQDFKDGELTGIQLEPRTDYTIATVGIDEYNVLCDISRVDFTSPSVPVTGAPYVEVSLEGVTKTSATVMFTPNEDTYQYSYVLGEKGSLQQQYEMFASMFGYKNIGEMIEAWGIVHTEEDVHTWTGLVPGAEYEIFIQTRDTQEVMPEHQVFYLKTESLGGEGEASVEVTLGDYKKTEWDGEMLPSQFVTYTPNDQASCYRFGVYLASIYDPEAEAIKDELRTDCPEGVTATAWYSYESITTDYQINPNTEFVIIAAAKNINGEWGPITEVRHTTPATVNMPAKQTSTIGKRKAPKKANMRGMLPTINKTQKATLKAK